MSSKNKDKGPSASKIPERNSSSEREKGKNENGVVGVVAVVWQLNGMLALASGVQSSCDAACRTPEQGGAVPGSCKIGKPRTRQAFIPNRISASLAHLRALLCSCERVA